MGWGCEWGRGGRGIRRFACLYVLLVLWEGRFPFFSLLLSFCRSYKWIHFILVAQFVRYSGPSPPALFCFRGFFSVVVA